MKFDNLSNEAKLLLIIGEPLRRRDLSNDQWIDQMWLEWSEVTKKGRAEFIAAFTEIADFSKR